MSARIIRRGPHVREFQGRTYRRDPSSSWSSNRRYFKPSINEMRAGARALHTDVWKFYRGDIPAGHHVHHRRGNTNWNRLRDLRLMAKHDHEVLHPVADHVARKAHLAQIRPVRGSAYHAKAAAKRARRKRRRR